VRDACEVSKGYEINMITLSKIVQDYDINDAILKMDCEGCEYSLLNEDNNTLGKFSMIQIEYHYGYEKLKQKLEDSGFVVYNTEPKQVITRNASNPNLLLGYIYAIRRE
jgi:hypothetical protein